MSLKLLQMEVPMKYLILALIFSSSSAFANAYVKCGKSVNQETNKVTGYELELSSDNDNFSGVVGKNWNLSLEKENNWMKTKGNENVTAQMNKDKEYNVTVEVFIRGAKTASGWTGTRYVLANLYSDFPTLEKWTLGGGIVGPMKQGSYKCYSGND
jgi:hypothetical protein